MEKAKLESAFRAAAAGSEEGGRALVRELVDDVHRLAMRMLWHPIDAEDATEEILVDVLSNLEELADDVRIGALRIAAAFLLRTYASPMERQDWSFEEMAQHLRRGVTETLPAEVPPEVVPVFAEEVKIGCSQTMLLCLDRPHRLAYVLAELFAIDHDAAARIVGVELVHFRALLEGAKNRLHPFMSDECGIVNESAPCRCNRRLGRDLRTGRVDPRRLLFVVPADTPRAPCAERARSDAARPTDPARVFRDQELRPAPPWIAERVAETFRARHMPALLRA